MKQFKILASDLPEIKGNVGKHNPSKFIIRFHFSDFSNSVNTMKLLIYPTDGHINYGKNKKPIEIDPDITLPDVNIANPITLGNLELIIKNFIETTPPPPANKLRYIFDELILTPSITIKPTNPGPEPQLDENCHLSFKVKAFKNGTEITVPHVLAIEDNDANPSPPKAPGD